MVIISLGPYSSQATLAIARIRRCHPESTWSMIPKLWLSLLKLAGSSNLQTRGDVAPVDARWAAIHQMSEHLPHTGTLHFCEHAYMPGGDDKKYVVLAIQGVTMGTAARDHQQHRKTEICRGRHSRSNSYSKGYMSRIRCRCRDRGSRRRHRRSSSSRVVVAVVVAVVVVVVVGGSSSSSRRSSSSSSSSSSRSSSSSSSSSSVSSSISLGPGHTVGGRFSVVEVYAHIVPTIGNLSKQAACCR